MTLSGTFSRWTFFGPYGHIYTRSRYRCKMFYCKCNSLSSVINDAIWEAVLDKVNILLKPLLSRYQNHYQVPCFGLPTSLLEWYVGTVFTNTNFLPLNDVSWELSLHCEEQVSYLSTSPILWSLQYKEFYKHLFFHVSIISIEKRSVHCRGFFCNRHLIHYILIIKCKRYLQFSRAWYQSGISIANKAM